MNDRKPNEKLDGRDELILMIVAFVIPLTVLPSMLGM